MIHPPFQNDSSEDRTQDRPRGGRQRGAGDRRPARGPGPFRDSEGTPEGTRRSIANAGWRALRLWGFRDDQMGRGAQRAGRREAPHAAVSAHTGAEGCAAGQEDGQEDDKDV